LTETAEADSPEPPCDKSCPVRTSEFNKSPTRHLQILKTAQRALASGFLSVLKFLTVNFKLNTKFSANKSSEWIVRLINNNLPKLIWVPQKSSNLPDNLIIVATTASATNCIFGWLNQENMKNYKSGPPAFMKIKIGVISLLVQNLVLFSR